MALLFMDGFGGGTDATQKWDITSTAYSTQTATPRTPGCYYGRLTSVRNMYKSFTPSSKIVIGIGIFSPDRAWNFSFSGDGGVTTHITIVWNMGTGMLELRRGTSSGTLLVTGTQPLYQNQWNYIEASVTISDTVGEVHVRLNGSPTDEISFVGDTKNGGTNTTVDKFTIYSGNGAASYINISDCYILNDTGSSNNDFLGDVVVRTLSPSSNGTYTQLTGSDGNQIDNYLLVDEHPYSSTDYVGSATPGDKDTYVFEDLPGGVATVHAVQVNGMMSKNDGGVASARYVIRSAGSDYPGTTRALTTSYTAYQELHETDPATGISWTPAAVNDLESGMEVI